MNTSGELVIFWKEHQKEQTGHDSGMNSRYIVSLSSRHPQKSLKSKVNFHAEINPLFEDITAWLVQRSGGHVLHEAHGLAMSQGLV